MYRTFSYTHQLHDEHDEVSHDGDGTDTGEVPGDQPEGILGRPAERSAKDRHLCCFRSSETDGSGNDISITVSGVQGLFMQWFFLY